MVAAEGDLLTFLEMATNWLPSVRLTTAMNAQESDVRVWLWTLISADSPETQRDADARLNTEVRGLEANLVAYAPLTSSDEERNAFTNFKERWGSILR